jgi:hypothetical protein
VDLDGEVADFWQGGSKVTLHGPGVRVTCESKGAGAPSVDEGTSLGKFISSQPQRTCLQGTQSAMLDSPFIP